MTGRYKAYPEYKDSGIEWLKDMPTHWQLTRAKHLFKRVQRPVRPEDGIVTAFRDGEVTLRSNRRVDGFTNAAKEIGYQGVRKGDLLVHAMDGFAGAIGMSDSDGKCSPVCSVCVPWESGVVDTEYYGYLVRQLAVTDFITSLAKGIRERSTEFRFGELSALPLAVPPYIEQQKIANFLSHETAKIDTLITKQEKLIELLKEKRQAVISHAVTKGLNPDVPMKDSGVEWLGDVPEHWGVIQNKRLFELTPKKSQIESKKNELCNFVPMDKLKQDTLILDEERIISSVFDGYTYFENEDILIAKVTPCFENKNMVVARNMKNGIGFGSSEIYVLRCNSKVNNDFMYYRLQEDVFMNIAISAMTGAGGLKRVPADIMMNFKLALPPLEEQLEISKTLKDKLAIFDELSVKAVETIELMKERKTALISAAVTGKIDVRDWQESEQR
ncbi:restriction endonuclease subunit S [Vibrio parahaemolyticus]|nr:restriction endonuclease subunit S [Vibrio parahaemolyticus]MBE4440222.1 restriction endonuclease subunit S [Vibrio parahaemolyticus]